MTAADLRERCAALIARLADGSRDDSARDALLDELARAQAERVPSYAKFLGSEPRRPNGRLPALPTDVFRYARVAAHDASEDVRVFKTSGTTVGDRGAHAFRDLSLYDLAARSFARRMLFPDRERMRLLILAPTEANLSDSSLSYMLARFLDWFGTPQSAYVFAGNQLDAKALAHALEHAERDSEPVALLGTSFAFVHAHDALPGRAFRLPHGSRIMQTGGFKGRSRSVEPAQMIELLSAQYGIPPAWIVQEYGMTELSSQLYETTLREAALSLPATSRRLCVPGWVRAEPIDPDTLQPAAPGEVGLLRIDDLANFDSVCAIQTSDLARREGDGLVVLGRAQGAIPRGCSIAVDEWRNKP
ncbi:MAG TPA: acyl-protein synthetase [Polyangiales bacterium]|nr:acyl-protein synthetase [Polyangiales bacterium]